LHKLFPKHHRVTCNQVFFFSTAVGKRKSKECLIQLSDKSCATPKLNSVYGTITNIIYKVNNQNWPKLYFLWCNYFDRNAHFLVSPFSGILKWGWCRYARLDFLFSTCWCWLLALVLYILDEVKLACLKKKCADMSNWPTRFQCCWHFCIFWLFSVQSLTYFVSLCFKRAFVCCIFRGSCVEPSLKLSKSYNPFSC